MFDFWWNCLSRVGIDDDIELGSGAQREAQPSEMHNELTPRSSGDAVISEESRRDRVLVPFRAGTHQGQTVGEFSSIAERTRELRPEFLIPSLFVHYPFPKLERRTVTYVLAVTAGQLRYPLAVLVTMEASYSSLDRSRRCGHGASSLDDVSDATAVIISCDRRPVIPSKVSTRSA
jgi:hypothetical protein